MPKYIAITAGLAVFLFWLSLVGNPHAVETVIGLVMAVGAGIWSYMKMKSINKKSEE